MRIAKWGALAVTIAVLAAGCGSAAQVATTPQAKEAEKVLQGCLSKGSLVTAAGRQKIVACIAPPGHEAALEKCVSAAASKDGFVTSGDRRRLTADILSCVETNR